jgi:hypothetical protein
VALEFSVEKRLEWFRKILDGFEIIGRNMNIKCASGEALSGNKKLLVNGT